MNIDIIVAIISGLVALIAAILSYFNQVTITKLKYRLDIKSKELDKKEELEKLLSKYRDPLLRATCDFQSRLYSIIQLGFLKIYYNRSDKDRDYAVSNTLYVTAEYLGWVEILRQEIQFLDLGQINLTQEFNELIERITSILLTDNYDLTYRLFRGEQRAIGEIMIDKSDKGLICIGYAQFKHKLNEKEFKEWFESLITSITALSSMDSHDKRFKRLVNLQHSLVDLIDFLDPNKVRISTNRRSKINF